MLRSPGDAASSAANLAVLRCVFLLGVAAGCGAVRDDSARITIPVTSNGPEVEREIAPGVRLRLRPAGGATGWDVEVHAAGDTSGFNLLYHSREWHGPYPTQVSAWAEAKQYFGPGERELPVHGHPWVVLMECERCKTTGSRDAARFTAGTLRVEWRRSGAGE